MKNLKIYVIFLATFSILTSCCAKSELLSTNDSSAAKSYEQIIKDYPCYKKLSSDSQLTEQFEEYMKWLSALTPDAKLVYGYMQKKNPNIFELSFIFHEKVEFYGWLQLGHKFKDIMNIEYYKKHYPEVYPIAHRKAVVEEIGLIQYFTQKEAYKKIPEIAYMLVSPLCDMNSDIPIDRLLSRLKYNYEYLNQIHFVTKQNLRKAVKIFTIGGYKYNDEKALINKAYKYVEDNKNTVFTYPADNNL